MNWWEKLICRLGLHNWHYSMLGRTGCPERVRTCVRCLRRELRNELTHDYEKVSI